MRTNTGYIINITDQIDASINMEDIMNLRTHKPHIHFVGTDLKHANMAA